MVLPEEDAAGLEALEAALVEELAPAGPLQLALARRVAIAAWRLMRADRMEVEVLDFRRGAPDNLGLALIRDGNGTRAIETLLRYRGAAMAEFWRALRTLKALQAERASGIGRTTPARAIEPEAAGELAPPTPPPHRRHPRPDEPDRHADPRLGHALPERSTPGRALNEATASWTPAPFASRRPPNEPEPYADPRSPGPRPPVNPPPAALIRPGESLAPGRTGATPNKPESSPTRAPRPASD